MTFDADGWPVVSDDPWNVCDFTGKTDCTAASNVGSEDDDDRDGGSGDAALGTPAIIGIAVGGTVVVAALAAFAFTKLGGKSSQGVEMGQGRA